MRAAASSLRAEVRAFLAAELAAGSFEPTCNAWMDAFDPAFSRKLAERGWIGMTWPREYGGGDHPAHDRHAVTEELLAAGAPVAAHWFADRQVGPQLLRFGNEAQRRRHLPAIARAERFFAIGMSEPGAGSDLAAVRTVAERVSGGWRVTGDKVWTSHAHVADHMVALCRTGRGHDDRHEGLSQLIVDLRAEGVTVTPIRGIDGAHHFCEVRLDGVLVEDADLIGEPGQGWRQVTSELTFERAGPERFLSTFPLLRAAVAAAGPEPDAADAERLGRAFATLTALRRQSLGVVDAVAAGVDADVDAALVKDQGTRFERDLVEALRCVTRADDEAGARLEAMLAHAQLAAPGFTLRGGTTEILRGIIGRSVVGR